MNRTIHKFVIDAPSKIIKTDPNAHFLHVAQQRGVPCVWAIVDTDVEHKDILLMVYGTGHRGFDQHTYIGTWQDEHNGLVWHLFKGTPNGPTP
jgi:hypothetical protein